MEITPIQLNDLMRRFPNFELSYETISHKKVSSSYNICLAIPQGKKCFAWFTFFGDKDVCILLDINREKKICKGTILDVDFKNHLELGTLVYGSLVENEQNEFTFFVIEDIIFYKGIQFKKSSFQEKLGFMNEFMNSITQQFKTKKSVAFALPVMWDVESTEDFDAMTTLPEHINKILPYPTHHVQYRCLIDIKPYLNSVIVKKISFTPVVSETKKVSKHKFETIPLRMDFSKPQYRYPTVFQITADIQYDIYHMFAYGKNSKPVYYNVAYIPNYKTSVFMNSLYRKIKENQNLDFIEESDDEEDFQNTEEDKYVDIDKVLLVECVFNTKFKKWIPLRVVDNSHKIVHISKLCNDFEHFTSEKPRYTQQQHAQHNTHHHAPYHGQQQQQRKPNYNRN